MKLFIAFAFSLSFISFTEFRSNIPEASHACRIDSLAFMFGNFTDDYGINYSISDSEWVQLPATKYHIIKTNFKEQYFIARNDQGNATEAGLYTRIDYMKFENMQPFIWGFCYTVYNAKTDTSAILSATANRNNPMKGCKGFPFSRMKKTER